MLPALKFKAASMAALPQWLATIGKAMRGLSEGTTLDPLPRRWIELIHHLNEEEQRHSQVRQPEPEPQRARVAAQVLRLCFLASLCSAICASAT